MFSLTRAEHQMRVLVMLLIPILFLFRVIIYNVVVICKLRLVALVRELKYIRDSLLKALKVVIDQAVLFKALLAQYTNEHQ